MGIARRNIIRGKCVVHVMWLMAHKDFLLKEERHKELLEDCIKRYKEKYNIFILERSIMDNHVHLVMSVRCVEDLSNFMRDMNSVFARIFNRQMGRCGNVVMDRFKSVVILSKRSLIDVIRYIWLNHVEAGKYSIEDIKNNRHCSLFYRSRGLKDPICDSYEVFCREAGIENIAGKSEQSFCLSLLDYIIKNYITKLAEEIWSYVRKVGDLKFLEMAKFKKNLKLIKQEYIYGNILDPPILDILMKID